MIHDIKIQSWGHSPVVVCTTCEPKEGQAALVLARGDALEGLGYAEVIGLVERHLGEMVRPGQNVTVVASERLAPDYAGSQVEGQVQFGTDPADDLVAYGPQDEFGPGYHPRTGQKL